MAAKKKNTISHDRRKNPGSREKWIEEKRVGRPKQTYNLATKTYTKTFHFHDGAAVDLTTIQELRNQIASIKVKV